MSPTLNIRLLLGGTILLFAGCAEPNASTEAAATSQPNIILVMTDDLGWGDVGFNGHAYIKTPNLDRLANDGIIFDRFYSASPVCSPTRASALTGRHPRRLDIKNANDGHMLAWEITLAELLSDAGYATGHFGKWHLGTLTTQMQDANRGRVGDSTNFSLPTQHGFDEYFSTESKVPTFDPMIKPAVFDTTRGEGLRYGWAAIEGDRERQAYGTKYWTHPDAPEMENLEGDNSRIIMDRVLPFIDRANAVGQPFFSVIWFHTPHLPVVADEALRNDYSGRSHAEQIYFGTISAMDAQVGRLWDRLESLGEAENTLLWFASDNGPENGTPGTAGPFRERKRSLHEGGVRVPAFAIWPARLDGGQRISTPAVTSDYLPTLVEYLDLSYPDDRELDGISLVHLLAGHQEQRGRPIGFHIRENRSWVDDTFKLISKDDGETYELYNIVEDPSEKRDISDENSARVQEMKAGLDAWLWSIEVSRARVGERD